MPIADMYSASVVRTLFDEMSTTYGITNYFASFGFAELWRRQCVAQVQLRPGMTVCDLMTGMGESWGIIQRRLGGAGNIVALDFSQAMCARARERTARFPELQIDVIEDDALASPIADNSADCVISTFGLKTMSDEQKQRFAQEIKRILKPGGVFSLVEISVPDGYWLRLPYMFYLKLVIPVVGKMCLGNPDNYRMLGMYTARFANCRTMERELKRAGLEVEYHSYFFGCASGVTGRRPEH